jgi:hypothetical protein
LKRKETERGFFAPGDARVTPPGNETRGVTLFCRT